MNAIKDGTQHATNKLLAWIDSAHLPEWVESELRESLEYMMELHNEKMAARKQVRP